MKKFTILAGRLIKARNIIVLDVTDEKGTKFPKGIVRTLAQWKEDLDQSDLPTDIHPVRLAGFSIFGDIEFHKAGSTYVADENAGVTKNDAIAAFNVTRAGKEVEIKIGQRALVGDLVTRTTDSFRTDFLTVVAPSSNKEIALVETAKATLTAKTNAFKFIFGFQESAQATSSNEEVTKTTTEKELDALLSE